VSRWIRQIENTTQTKNTKSTPHMKLKYLSLAALSAFAIAGSASATTLLLSDNFNTPSYNWWEFNNSLAADQGGTLAATVPVPYTTSTGGDGYTAQHSNGGAMLLTSDGWGGWGGWPA
jgi:hypothetical protein